MGLHHFNSEFLAAADDALNEWRSFLLSGTQVTDQFRHQLLPLDSLEESNVTGTPSNINRYILRSVDLDVACNSDSAFVYVKMCRLMLVGFIKMPRPSEWFGTQIEYDKGTIRPRHYRLPGEFGNFLMSRAENMGLIQNTISQKQQRKLNDAITSAPDQVAQSESFKAMLHDIELSGESAFDREPDQ
jgi:hypothetical protein